MNNNKPIRVLVVDDHDSVRQTLNIALLTYSDIEWAGEAVNGVEAVEQCQKTKPDVILMDFHMPKMDGVTATSIIRKQYPHVKIIAMTTFSDPFLVKTAVEAGADTYLYKDVSMTELANTIRSVGCKPSHISRNGHPA
jgi:DNA-binding NarL/FixJ family response regulator